MSRKSKRNKKRRHKGPRKPQASRPSSAAAIARLIESGQTRAALEQAKTAHKLRATPESEGVLIDAYVARATELAAEGLDTEAAALVDLACRRFAGARAQAEGLAVVLRARRGELDELLRPLADPETPAARRAAIENVVRCEVTDLGPLAASRVLPDDHALKRGAAAVLQAFAAVTRGEIDDPATIALDEVSRRSPLAPWKLLVRALDAFYRGDDEACARVLDAMESSWQDGGAQDGGALPAPLRAVPALRAMTQRTADDELAPASSALVAGVLGGRQRLRSQVRRLDDAFARGNPSRILDCVRQTEQLVQRHAPELVDRFRQHVSVRCMVADLPAPRVLATLGGPVLHDATFWRLFARACEARHLDPVACAAWERFLRHAVAERWFAAAGPEAAAVHLHAAELLAHLDAEALAEVREDFGEVFGFESMYADQPPHVRALAPRATDREELVFLRPERLYARASELGDPEAFRQWLAWCRRHRRPKAADRVALSWHAACPEDAAPLLHLAASAERRGAFKKALGFVAKAEALDRLSPEVRRARQRLLVAMTLRHLRQNMPHLADKDVAALAELPQLRSGDGPALLAALRWAAAAKRGDKKGAKEHRGEVARALESEAATLLVLGGLAAECQPGRSWHPSLPRKAPRAERNRLVPAVARAAALGASLEAEVVVPDLWQSALIEELRTAAPRTPEELLALGEAALASWLPELAYAASGVGLAQEGAQRARFLILRGKSLPPWAPDRALECLHAAVALARRQGDPDLVSEVVELARRPSGLPLGELMGALDAAGPAGLPGDEIAEVLRRELEAREYPTEPDDEWGDDGFNPYCACPECTRRRAELGLEPLDVGGDEPGFPLELANLPPKLLRLMMEATLKYGGPGGDLPDPETIERLDPELSRKIEEAILEYRARGGTLPARTQRRRRRKRRR